MKRNLLASTTNLATHITSVETDFLSCEAAASILNMSPRTLERFRLEGRGPAYCKFGRLVRYPRAALVEWAMQQQRNSTAKAA